MARKKDKPLPTLEWLHPRMRLMHLASLFLLGQDLGKSKAKPKFSEILSKSRAINVLSAARMFLFGARDVWFVVALPVHMPRCLAGITGRWVALWPAGLSAMVLSRRLRRKSLGTPTVNLVPCVGRQCWR